MNEPLHPADELAAILAHYLRTLTTLSGKRWTERNDADIARIAALLDELATTTTETASDVMPAYEKPIVSDRQTLVLDQDERGWAEFRRWQAERAEEERYDQARRIMRR